MFSAFHFLNLLPETAVIHLQNDAVLQGMDGYVLILNRWRIHKKTFWSLQKTENKLILSIL